MNWGAHKADVRIAAKNSITMRAALRASINAQTIYEAYQETQPSVTDNNTQDRTRARAWAMLNVKIDPEPIKAALIKIYTDGFLLGLDASEEAFNKAEKEFNKAALTKANEYIDWANWKPGNRAAALLYRPTGAFKEILDNAGIVSKTIAKAGYDRIGTALSDSIAAGFSPGRAAKIIAEKIGDPARALTIAITEQNRAVSMATMQNYERFGLEKMEWSGAMPCDICAQNEGQVVAIGQPFKSGHTQPPAHPNCRCALLPPPFDDGFYAEENGSGLDLMPLEEAAPEIQGATGLAIFNEIFDKGKYRILNADERHKISAYQLEDKPFMALMKQDVIEDGRTYQFDSRVYQSLINYKGMGYEDINGLLRGEAIGRFTSITKVREKIADIKRAMKKAPGLPEPITTYRAVRNANLAEFLANQKPGSIWGDKGFVSTSMDEKFALDWEQGTSKWLITVESPAGTKGIMLDGLRHKNAGQEAEWLLPANTQFQVIEINKEAQTMRVRVVKK